MAVRLTVSYRIKTQKMLLGLQHWEKGLVVLVTVARLLFSQYLFYYFIIIVIIYYFFIYYYFFILTLSLLFMSFEFDCDNCSLFASLLCTTCIIWRGLYTCLNKYFMYSGSVQQYPMLWFLLFMNFCLMLYGCFHFLVHTQIDSRYVFIMHNMLRCSNRVCIVQLFFYDVTYRVGQK